MKYAPIAIPTMCRYKHFVRMIESLKSNSWAKYTDVFIGLDYPPSSIYEQGYKQICEYLEGDFSEFASFTVIKHEKNLGSFGNMKFLFEMVFSRYDRLIRTDDDAEFSPNFIEYMDKCLMEYEADLDVIAVSGYSYPVEWKVSEGATAFKENFICPMWGTGFWKDKLYIIKQELRSGCLQQTVDWVVDQGIYKRMIKSSQIEYINLCTPYALEENLIFSVTDIAMRMYSVIYNKYIILPVESKVKNWGFDGSGEFCSISTHYAFNKQLIDMSLSFKLTMDTLCDLETNREVLNKFENVKPQNLYKAYIKAFLYRIFGRYAFYYRLFKHNFKC